ncbi:MAG TPA: DNA methyltransferase [Pyrinomonadaceae bacterium]|nr:DNA methyltransferase [Pyrinomonadaceae bacterium]
MPYTKEQARLEIANLVANFRANEPNLADVPEAQIEDNYIRKLFRFLNWNTDNAGLSIAEWEFVLQRTDEKGKRPDYILQLDGQQLLVMDAKKVKYDMHDPRWMQQVYAYAYSTQNQPTPRKIDFAVLTDFQEFVLLDCTLYAADPKAVSNFRILDWSCDDYVSQFDTLWELFERENIRAAARTRETKNPSGLWARYLSPKKVKANRIPPDKAFLAEMDDEKTGWRVRLAKDMKKRNPDADGALITAAVQLLIDRLIFVKALSDREIEEDYLTQLAEQVEKSGLAADDAGWFNACRDIFAKLNQFYNGSIFEPRPELEAVTVSNKVVREVIRDLQPENSPYHFAVLPVEILGTIYERFLGRVVRATDSRVKIEDKPEVRKAGGVYYTPQYIVDYIVQNTVGELLARCKTPAEAAKLRILDPACGSGSFLLGAYTALIRWHEAYYSDKGQLTKRDREAAYYDSDGRVRLTAKLKRQILLNNLYGVDIDEQAVEVTRFSLSLKALEDTRRDELTEEVNLFKQTVLPDLRNNIKCGNSLIGPDYFTGQMFADKEELLRVKPFDWGREFAEVFDKTSRVSETREVSGGFDAVIGNPPYVRQESLSAFKVYWQKHYKSYNSTADLYVYFIERGLSLLREGGLFSIIVSSSFLRTTYALPLRKHIRDSYAIRRLVDFGGLSIFADAKDVYVCIPVFGKTQQTKVTKVCRISTLDFADLSSHVSRHEYIVPLSRYSENGWSLENELVTSTFAKIQANSLPLGEYVQGRIYYGLKTGLNEAFEIDPHTRDEIVKKAPQCSSLIKPFLGGQDIRRYFVRDPRYLIVIPSGWTSEQIQKTTNRSTLSERSAWDWFSKGYHPLAKHLEKFAEDAKKRQDKGEFWWELRPCDYYGVLDGPKIIYPDIAKNPRFVLDTTRVYIANTAYCLGSNDLYLLGLLNSKLFWFSIARVSIPFGTRAGEFRYRLIYQYMEKVPIRLINFSDPVDKARHDKMVQLVESMLALHKHKAAARTQAEQEQIQRQIEATDRQIDALVYELYRLTEEEIAVVSG